MPLVMFCGVGPMMGGLRLLVKTWAVQSSAPAPPQNNHQKPNPMGIKCCSGHLLAVGRDILNAGVLGWKICATSVWC
jgi:hypothetical protein